MSDTDNDRTTDLRHRIKQLTQPLVDSLDAKLRDEVDTRVVAIVNDRLSVLERAVADLDRGLRALEARLDEAP